MEQSRRVFSFLERYSMTDATQTANADARQASMSRVETQETLLQKLAPTEAAKEPAKEEKSEAEKTQEGESKPKKGAQERIQELIAKQREAESKAEAKEREAAELRARLEALSTNPKALEASTKPLRSQFASDDEYIEALADFKAKEAIRKREEEALKAREEAAQAELADRWNKRQEAVMKALPDYAEVIGKSEISVPNHIHAAILKSDQGPQIAYYLALHPEEAKRISRMDPIDGIWKVREIARDLAEIDAQDVADSKAKDDPKQPQKSKAPQPIDPPRSAASSSTAGTTSFDEYKRRRQAEQRK